MKHVQCVQAALAVVLLSGAVYAQPRPDWVPDGISPRYPASLAMTGFGFIEGDNASERRDSAVQKARADLSAKFLVKIQSEVNIHESEVNRQDRSEYRNTVSSQTQLRLIDVPVLRWDDTRSKTAYALAVMEKEPAVRNYSAHLKEATGELASLLRLAEEAEKGGRMRDAVALYRKTFPVFVDIGETKAVLQILNARNPFAELETADAPKLPAGREEIESRISRLLQERVTTPQDAAVSLAEQLAAQWSGKEPVAVYTITYRDTDFGSQFSSSFHALFTAELARSFTVVSPEQARPAVTVTGAYWVEGDAVRIIPLITDLATGKKLAAASVSFPKASVERAGIELKPQNFIQAMEDGRVFLPADVIPGGLSLEVWTTKGSRNLIFKKDERLEIMVRVNKHCYLRVLYHLANGPRILLFDNHYVDVSKVNRAYTLPKKFCVAPPFGVERLQVFASEKEFPPVATGSAVFDGQEYTNVLREDIKELVARSRGLVEDGEAVIVDRVVTMTTVRQ